jgi:hypothetical protein
MMKTTFGDIKELDKKAHCEKAGDSFKHVLQ